MITRSQKRKADCTADHSASSGEEDESPNGTKKEKPLVVPLVKLFLSSCHYNTKKECSAWLSWHDNDTRARTHLGPIAVSEIKDPSNVRENKAIDVDRTLESAYKGVMGYCATRFCLCVHCRQRSDDSRLSDGVKAYNKLSPAKLQKAKSKVVLNEIIITCADPRGIWKNGLGRLDMCVNLTSLMIKNVAIKSTAFLRQCVNLENLWLDECQLDPPFPPEIVDLEKLQRLDMYENQLTAEDIDPRVFTLPELKTVDFTGNQIEDLPLTWGRFQGDLELSWNPCLQLSWMKKHLTDYAYSRLVLKDRGTGTDVVNELHVLPFRLELLRLQYKLAMILCAGLAGEANQSWITFLMRGLYDPRLFLTISAFATNIDQMATQGDDDSASASSSSHSADSSFVDLQNPGGPIYYRTEYPVGFENEENKYDSSDSFIASEDEDDGEDDESFNPSVDQVDASEDSGSSSVSSSSSSE